MRSARAEFASHDRTELPRHEFVLAKAVRFALARLARCGLQDQLENTLADFLHTGVSVDYVGFGIHSSDLALETKAQLTTDVMNDLATVNHISVFATGYGPEGVHLVHREGSLHDGLIVTEPLSPTAHLRLFSFSTQTF